MLSRGLEVHPSWGLRSFWWLPAILDISWLAATGLQVSAPAVTWPFPLHFFVSLSGSSLLIRTPVIWDLGPIVTHYDIILTTSYICQKLCFQIRSRSQFPPGCEFGGERDAVEPSALTQGRFTGLFGTAWFSFTVPFNILIPHITKKELYRE